MGADEDIKIGVASVTYKGTNLGHTKGGVVVSYGPEYTDITADEYGKTPVDKALAGEKVTIKVPLAEEAWSNFKVAMPAGRQATGVAGTNLEVGADAGKLLSEEAGILRLHPTARAAGDLTKDFVGYKAVATGSAELNFKVDEERVIEVTFELLIDETKVAGNRLFHIGIDSIS